MTVQIALRISDDLAHQVDSLTGDRSRSDLLRLAIEQYVERERRAEIDRRVAAAYAETPQSAIDEWGSLDEWATFGAAATMRQLDEEDGGWE